MLPCPKKRLVVGARGHCLIMCWKDAVSCLSSFDLFHFLSLAVILS